MTISEFTSKLNWRLILVHLLACWFIAYAFSTLIVLHDMPVIIAVVNHKNKDLMHLGMERMVYANMWNAGGKGIGALFAFIISLIITRYCHWYWLNSLLTFVLAFLLCRYDFPWRYVRSALLTPGALTHSLPGNSSSTAQ